MGLQKNQLLTLLMGVQTSVAAVETWGSLKASRPLLCMYLKELKTGSEETSTQPRSLHAIYMLFTCQEAETTGMSMDRLTD